jgi:tRNA/tmRNA/rRNA uracil-C5-methylase (TrmA/RlmC/RlmD family)
MKEKTEKKRSNENDDIYNIKKLKTNGKEEEINTTINKTPTYVDINALYICLECQVTKISNSYSKSQLNKFLHNKINGMKCSDCILKIENKEKNDILIKKNQEIERNKCKKQPKIVKDPSTLYIRDPKQAPIVINAQEYFSSRFIDFDVKLGTLHSWRTVCKMAVRGSIERKKTKNNESDNVISTIGLFKPGSHDIINCLTSEAHHPNINRTLQIIQKSMIKANINGYIEGSGLGDGLIPKDGEEINKEDTILFYKKYKPYLKYLLLTVERKSTKVQLTIVWNSEYIGNEEGDELLKTFIAILIRDTSNDVNNKDIDITQDKNISNLIHSIWVNYNPSSRYNNAITSRDENGWKLFYGHKYVREIVETNMKFPPKLKFPPFVFRQANIDSFTNIIQEIRKWIVNMNKIYFKNNNDNLINCVELYGGVGTIGLNCLDLFSKLSCSDENPHNKKCYESTLSKMKEIYQERYNKNVFLLLLLLFILFKIYKNVYIYFRATYYSESATDVSNRGGLNNCDLVIVDPPRKGLDDEVIDSLLVDNSSNQGKNI